MSHSHPTRTRRAAQAHQRTRLRHRLLQAERLEDRRLLAGDFELSSLLPANGGDGSSGFVMNGSTDKLQLGRSANASPPSLGDVNGDNIDDFYLPALGSTGDTAFTLFQAYIIYGRGAAQGGFPAELDLSTLDGTNGYVIDSVDLYRTYQTGMWGGVLGDINGDGFSDISIDQIRPAASGGYRSFVLFGGSENLSALDQADGTTDGHIKLSTVDTATDGTRGFVIDTYVLSAGDVNGDHVDDLVTTKTTDEFQGVYVIYGRDSNQGNSFPAAYELSSLLPVHGGSGSEGFVIPAVSSSGLPLSVRSAGDVNNDGIGDVILADPYASPLGRTTAGQAWVIFGQSTNFPVTFDLASLNGSNGFTVYGKTGEGLGLAGARSAGDVNGDNADDLGIGSSIATGALERNTYILFGKDTSTAGPFSAVLEVSSLNGSNGFVIAGYDTAASLFPVGDVNGDGNDDVAIGFSGQNYIIYGRPSFGARLELPSLLAANGGDGSAGYALSGFPELFGACQGIGDINLDGFADVRIGAYQSDSNGLTDNGRVYVVYGKSSTPVTTKFYVVNDATQNLTYEYNVSGMSVESYSLNSGNTAPRGAASTIAGTKTWVVDVNRKVYVYDTEGGLLGSWTAGTLSTKAVVEGIATNGTDIWIVDAYSDKVYKYAGAATRLSSSQNAVSSFSLNSANKSPKDIVTDGASLWVVNDSTTDKVFKYTTAGALVSSWTVTTAGATSPTGITIDPANVSNIWIVDNGTDRVYQYNAAVNLANGSSKAADVSFALSAANTNPQGIADTPAPSSLLTTETPVPSAEAAISGNDAALASMYEEPLKKVRIDTVRRSESRAVEPPTRDLTYTVGAATIRVSNDSVANDKHHTEVDDLFAQRDSDPLELLSFPDLGA